MTNEPIEIRDDREAMRYEASIDGQIALVDYSLKGDTLDLTHTEVPKALEGRGIGGQLVRFVLDDARARGLTVIPSCSFVAAYIERHPEYRDLLG